MLNPTITVDNNRALLEFSLKAPAVNPGLAELRFERLRGTHGLRSEIPGGVQSLENTLLTWHPHHDGGFDHQITHLRVALETSSPKLFEHCSLAVASLSENRSISIEQAGIKIPLSQACPERCVGPGWTGVPRPALQKNNTFQGQVIGLLEKLGFAGTDSRESSSVALGRCSISNSPCSGRQRRRSP